MMNKTIEEKSTMYNLILKDAEKKKEIKTAFIELLDQCNYSCRYCYIKGTYGKYMPIKAYKEITRQLREKGCIWLTLTGGECLLHPCFNEMYLYAYDKGFRITVLTNGYLITEKICKLFKNKPPHALEMTLYGYDGKSYDEFVGKSGAFEQFEKNLQMLKDNGVKFGLKSVLSTVNYKDLDLLISFSKQYTNNFRYDTMVVPTLNDRKSLDIRLAPKTVLDLEMRDERYLQIAKEAMDNYIEDHRLFKCSAGLNYVCIDENLQMSYCAFARRNCYQLDENNIDIEAGHKWLVKQHESVMLAKTDKCYSCKYKPICRYCPARFYLETGSENNPPKWYCDMAEELYTRLSQKASGETCIPNQTLT